MSPLPGRCFAEDQPDTAWILPAPFGTDQAMDLGPLRAPRVDRVCDVQPAKCLVRALGVGASAISVCPPCRAWRRRGEQVHDRKHEPVSGAIRARSAPAAPPNEHQRILNCHRWSGPETPTAPQWVPDHGRRQVGSVPADPRPQIKGSAAAVHAHAGGAVMYWPPSCVETRPKRAGRSAAPITKVMS